VLVVEDAEDPLVVGERLAFEHAVAGVRRGNGPRAPECQVLRPECRRIRAGAHPYRHEGKYSSRRIATQGQITGYADLPRFPGAGRFWRTNNRDTALSPPVLAIGSLYTGGMGGDTPKSWQFSAKTRKPRVAIRFLLLFFLKEKKR
jgi:hypothetical protein